MTEKIHEMRRSDRKLTDEETKQILAKGEYGILSTYGEDGYPYGVPLSYVYAGEKIYFHCSSEDGYKIQNMKYCNKVCFTVVGKTEVLPDQFATRYESVIAHGEVRKVTDKLPVLKMIQEKYSPDYAEKGIKYANSALDRVSIYEMQIERMTGKAKR